MQLLPKEAGFSPERLKRVDSYLSGLVESNQLAGVAAYLFRHGKSAYQYCTGWLDKEKAIPLKEDAIYLTCSLSKTFTIVTLMTLYEKGLFRLEDPVSRFIPEFKDVTVAEEYFGSTRFVPAKREMTVEHLCTMTSGLPYPSSSSISAKEFGRLLEKFEKQNGREPTTLEKAKIAAKTPLSFHPGEGWLYGFSSDVLGALIEVISGKHLGEYMKEALLDPLGLTDTGFFVPKEKRSRLITCYTYDGKSLKPYNDRPAPDAPPAFESGGGGVYSTMGDVARFSRMLLQDGELDGTRILSRKTVELIRCNHLDEEQLRQFHGLFYPRFKGYGYGLSVRTMMHPEKEGLNGSIGEWGWDGMMGTWHFIDPAEDMVAVFMMQRIPGGHEDLPKLFMQAVYGAIDD